MKRKHKRLSFVFLGFLALAGAAALILTAFEENLVFFHSPTDLVQKQFKQGQRLRVGGLVEKGSVRKSSDGSTNIFTVTDLANSVTVSFRGLLPDLFSEGQGIVAEGVFTNGQFVASNVLAKHDETYLPPEVAEALKKSGKWQGPEAKEGAKY